MDQLLGIVGFADKGNFVIGTPYEYLNVVYDGENTYYARRDNIDVPLTDANTWRIIGKNGKDGQSIVVLSNGNFGNWDKNTGTYVDTGIPASAQVDVASVEVAFTEALVRENIITGEKVSTIFGKIRKVIKDLGILAFRNSVDYTTEVSGAPIIPTNTNELANGSDYRTGTQVNNSISNHNTNSVSHGDIRETVENKVDKVEGKGLSNENYTLEEKEKLAGLESSKFKGEYTSLEELQTAWPSAGVGSYAFVDAGIGEDTQKYIWDSSDEKWIISGSTGEETPATIKEKYESNPDTNAFSDTEKNKLSGLSKSVDKSTTIANATWIQQGDSTYNAIVYDSDILEDSKVSVMPADSNSYDIYAEAVVFGGTSSAGQLLLRAKNAPSDDVNINYTITI